MVHGGSPHQAPAALTALDDAVADLAVAPVTDELVELMRIRDRSDAKTVEALAAFFQSGGHVVDGYRSPISWLRAHVPVTGRDASLLVTWAKRVPDWPVLATLWFDGELNRAQYAAVCARLQNPRLIELYAEHDAEVSPLLVGLSVTDTTTAIDQWAQMAESVLAPDPAEVEVPEPGDPMPVDGELKVSRYGDGIERGMVTGDLDPDATTTVQKALAAAMRPLVEGDTRTHSQRQAEAFVRICERFLDHAACDGGRGKAAARMLVVAELADLYRTALWGLGITAADDLERLLAVHPVSLIEEGWLRSALAHATGTMRTVEGWPLSAPEVTRLFGKNSTIERVMLADGQVLDHGRKVRLYTGGIRDVILVRDRSCRFPSPTGEPCGAPVPWLHAHHAQPWEEGGDTSTANGVALCPVHHALVHSPGWNLDVEPDGTVIVTTPDGTTLTGPPPGADQPPTLPLHHPKIDAIPKRLPPPPDKAASSSHLAEGPTASREPNDATPRRLPGEPGDAPVPLAGSPPDGATGDDDRPDRPQPPDRAAGWEPPGGLRSTIRIAEPAGPDEAGAEAGDFPPPHPSYDHPDAEVDVIVGRLETAEATAHEAFDLSRELILGLRHRSGSSAAVRRERSPDFVVGKPDGDDEIWVRLTTAA